MLVYLIVIHEVIIITPSPAAARLVPDTVCYQAGVSWVSICLDKLGCQHSLLTPGFNLKEHFDEVGSQFLLTDNWLTQRSCKKYNFEY